MCLDVVRLVLYCKTKLSFRSVKLFFVVIDLTECFANNGIFKSRLAHFEIKFCCIVIEIASAGEDVLEPIESILAVLPVCPPANDSAGCRIHSLSRHAQTTVSAGKILVVLTESSVAAAALRITLHMQRYG